MLTILVQARCEFGRDSLFETLTKLNSILQKGQQNPIVIMYIMETLFTFMLRKTKHPLSLAELQDKGGTVGILLWQRRYLAHLLQDYAGMLKVAGSAAKPPRHSGRLS